MAVTAKQIPKQQKIFNRVWEMFKKYYDEPNTDETWEKFLAETHEVCSEYDNDSLAVKLCLAIVTEKDERETKK